MLAVIILLPLAMFWMEKRATATALIFDEEITEDIHQEQNIEGAEKLDYSAVFSKLVGGIILCYVGYKIVVEYDFHFLSFFNPNNINLLLFALAITFHNNICNFLKAINKAIGGAAGILYRIEIKTRYIFATLNLSV